MTGSAPSRAAFVSSMPEAKGLTPFRAPFREGA